MPRVVHSEIHAADVQRAVTFYTEVFGWTSEDWSSFAGSPYDGLVTGPDDKPGINGAVMEAVAQARSGRDGLTEQRTHGLRPQASDVIQDVCRLA